MNESDLIAIMPAAKERAAKFALPLNAAMMEFNISTKQRQAAFLAQVAHESGQLYYVKEIASGRAYEGRIDLGNTMQGDGMRYKGRGLIQITGRDNYAACGKDLGLNLIDRPELLEEVVAACRSAAWFWKVKKLNELADKGDQVAICKRVNGGTNGLQDRIMFYNRAMKVIPE